jgi:thioredoxin-related protein
MKSIALSMLFLLAAGTGFSQAQVKWYSIEEAVALNKKQPRKMVIDVYTDWCKWCKEMDAKTYSNPVIVEYLNKNFYAVKFNAEQKADVVLNGKTYKYVANGSRGYNQLAAELLSGQLGYPSTVFLDEQTRLIQPVQGYIKAREFDGILRFIGGDIYKTKKWEDFQKGYNSPIAAE